MNVSAALIIFAAIIIIALVVWIALKATGGSKSTPISGSPADAYPKSTESSYNSNVQDPYAPAESKAADPGNASDEIIFTETTVIDSDRCSLRITGIDPASAWGYALTVLLTNKTEDKTCTFSVEDAAVNNVQCSALFSKEVAAGAAVKAEIDLPSADLAEKGITDFNDIELTFAVYDSDDRETGGYIDKETVNICPYGEDKRRPFIREATAFDQKLAENDNAAIIATGSKYNEVGDYLVDLYIINKTSSRIAVRADDVLLNGRSADPFYTFYVSAGKNAFSSIYWERSLLQQSGITEIHTIEFLLLASDEIDSRRYLSEKVRLYL